MLVVQIFQEKEEEELRFPKNRKNFDTLPVCKRFLENVSEFQKLQDMSVDLIFIFFVDLPFIYFT